MFGLMLLGVLSCSDFPCEDGFGLTPSGDCRPFAGQEPHLTGPLVATWTDADRMDLSWSKATGGLGQITYTITVYDPAGQRIGWQTTTTTSLELDQVEDGEVVIVLTAADEWGVLAAEQVSVRQIVGDQRIVLRSEVPLSGAMDVWGRPGSQNQPPLGILAGGNHPETDVMVVELSDLEAPEILSETSGLGHVRDPHLGDEILYVQSDCDCLADSTEYDDWNGVGGHLLDFSDPTAPVLLSSIEGMDASVHNLFFADDHLYLVNNFVQMISIYDVSDPTAPERVGQWVPPGTGMPHDITWADDLLYVAFWSGFAVLDVSDPSDPQEILVKDFDDPETAFHNIWPTADGDHVLTSEEKVGGGLRVWDITDTHAVTEVDGYWTDMTHSIHNVMVVGELAFVSWYVDGVWVFDVSDPTDLRRMANYDTYDGDESPVELAEDRHDGDTSYPRISGAWGVWPDWNGVDASPFPVLVGDTERGLMVFEFFPETVSSE